MMYKTRVYNVQITILIVIVVIWIAVSCGSKNLITPSPKVQYPPGAGQPKQQQTLFAVRMNAQQPIQPGFKTTSLIQPLSVTASLPAPKDVSVDQDFVALSGGEFIADQANLVVNLDTFAEFNANWESGQETDISNLAYAIYEFIVPAAGFTGESTVGITWHVEQQPGNYSDVWIGVSNWDANGWNWFEGPTDGVVTLPGLLSYINPSDNRVLIAVVVTGMQTCLLDRLSIGEPELRATGETEKDLPDAPPSFPPLYAPRGTSVVLPDSVDLSDGCAAINDQGTWGSCTAFAVGDGAFNYELNRMYSDLGWDLTDDVNLVSPKYLYVESGDQQNFPADPAYGRWTDQVINGLMSYGTATEENAPYDLNYDNDWTQDALDDAGELLIANWLPIPCNGGWGVQNAKTVLAYYEQPLVMRINLDYWFMYYEPNTVWTYTGPTYGGHAMLIVGYDDELQAFKVRNSWSDEWGDDGYVWIGYSTFSNRWAYVRTWALFADYDAGAAQRFTGQESALPPPTGLSASDGTDDEAIVLNWTSATEAIGYNVYRDSKSTLVAELEDVATWTDNGVQDQKSHLYWVTSTDSTDESTFCAPDLGYLAQPPEIQYIIPTSGREGRQAYFIADTHGSHPFEYDWDFGGAASPNTSTDAVADVALTTIGEYTVTLTVTSDWGEDTHQQAFTVHPGSAPLPDIDLDKSHGRTPLTVTFDASGSYDPDGAIELYEWDFDADGTYDDETEDATIEHTYTEVGWTECVVRVTDNSGLTATIGRGLEVLSTDNILPDLWWYGYTLEPPPVTKTYTVFDAYDQDGEIVNYEYDLDGDGAYEISGMQTEVSHTYTEHDTITTKCRVTDNEGGETVQTAQVQIGNGGSAPGWTVHTIADFALNQEVEARAIVIDGKPGVLVQEDDNQELYYYYSTVAQPDSTDDWEMVVVEDTVRVNNRFGLAVVDDAPVASFETFDTVGLVYGRFNGTSWDKHYLHSNGIGRSTIAEVNGKPCIAFYDPVLQYARSTIVAPDDSTDWVIMDVSDADDVGGDICLTSIGNIPMIGCGQRDFGPKLTFARATSVDPAQSTDWTWHFASPDGNSTNSISILDIGGTPALAWADSGGAQNLMVSRTPTATPSATGDWTSYPVENANEISDISLNWVGGFPAIGYHAVIGVGKIRLATASTTDPQSIDDWSIEEHDDRTWFQDLVDVEGKPAMIYSDRDTFTLYYYYYD